MGQFRAAIPGRPTDIRRSWRSKREASARRPAPTRSHRPCRTRSLRFFRCNRRACQPASCTLDVVERPAPTGADVAHDRAQAAQPAAPVVQVGGYGEEALVRQPVGLCRRSWLIPVKSWTTTTPGHGGGVIGTAQYAGMIPRPVRISRFPVDSIEHCRPADSTLGKHVAHLVNRVKRVGAADARAVFQTHGHRLSARSSRQTSGRGRSRRCADLFAAGMTLSSTSSCKVSGRPTYRDSAVAEPPCRVPRYPGLEL